ncbi:MAG: hypothetical protein DRO40_12190 [Thermoprotei archaeon]|nr:MAG: hypothetical protein DRO40_12190 [Thermoprotei archaeon]
MENWRSIISEVAKEKVRGASWCARRIAEAFIALSNSVEYNEDVLCEAIDLALKANPSMASIYNVVTIARKARNREHLMKLMKALLKYMRTAHEKVCSIAAESIMGNLMTISYSSVIECVLHKAKDKVDTVYVLESRPGGEGVLFAKALKDKGFNVKLVFDSTLHYYMSKTDIVIVGADSVGKDACIINKVGTSLLALYAREYGIEFYPVFESYKIHPEKSCYEIELVEREFEIEGYGKIRSVVFDRTPSRYISGLITEHGLIMPSRLGVKQAYEKFMEELKSLVRLD